MATIALESIPPLKKAPSGTSLIIRMPRASVRRRMISPQASCSSILSLGPYASRQYL